MDAEPQQIAETPPRRGRGRPRGCKTPWLDFDPPMSRTTWYSKGCPVGIPVECLHVRGIGRGKRSEYVRVVHVPKPREE